MWCMKYFFKVTKDVYFIFIQWYYYTSTLIKYVGMYHYVRINNEYYIIDISISNYLIFIPIWIMSIIIFKYKVSIQTIIN